MNLRTLAAQQSCHQRQHDLRKAIVQGVDARKVKKLGRKAHAAAAGYQSALRWEAAEARRQASYRKRMEERLAERTETT